MRTIYKLSFGWMLTLVASSGIVGKQQPRPAQPTPVAHIERAASPTSVAPIHAFSHHVAPMHVVVSGPERPPVGTPFKVSIAIDRVQAAMVPLELSVTLPAGARVIAGATRETIVDRAKLTFRRTLTVQFDKRAPANDLVVTVSHQTLSSGVTATGHYRFGRPEPKLAQPKFVQQPGMRGQPGIVGAMAHAIPVTVQ